MTTEAIRAPEADAPTTEQQLPTAETVAPTAEPAAPTTELLSGAVGDRCANCQAPLASDQRYCVNCGERRGAARFTGANAPAQAAPALGGAVAPPQRPRFSSSTTLVAGVATLLLAMGVGVLIGHDTNSSSPARQQILTIPSGGTSSTSGSTGGGSASTSSGGATTASSAAASSAAKKGKVPTVHLSSKTSQAASKAASQVIGSGAPKNPTESQGSSCTNGTPGCQNNKFTGNFFGGG